MQKTIREVSALTAVASANSETYVPLTSTIGQLVGLNTSGRPLVIFPERVGDEIIARTTVAELDASQLNQLPLTVTLMFENGNPEKPIVTGIVGDVLGQRKSVSTKDGDTLALSRQNTDVAVDGKKITFDAHEEIVLRCGKSSVVLRKDGKIVIKGTNVISRSSGANKIKGSSVNIN